MNRTVKVIGIEACAGAHYWARELNKLGHDTKLIAAHHVTPFVRGSKNDGNDAQAIAEIRSRASTPYVPINTEAQQDLQRVHRARNRRHERAEGAHLSIASLCRRGWSGISASSRVERLVEERR